MSTRSTAIARGVVIQVLAKFSALPMNVVTLGIATRYLGPEGYGIIGTAVVFVTTFEALSELGIGTIIVRRVSGRGADLESLVAMNLSFSVTYAIPLATVATLLGAGVYWGQTEQQLAIAVIALGLVFTTVATTFEPVFDVRVRYSAAATAEFLSRVLTLSAAAAVAYFDLGLLAMCAIQIIPQGMRMIMQWYGATRLAHIRATYDWSNMWGLLKESLPLTVIAVIGVLYWRADGLVLSLLAPTEEVAGYYTAVQIAFALTLISSVFERSVLSTVNETFNVDRQRFARAIDQGYRFLLLVGVPIAVVGWPLAGRMADFIAEEEVGAFAGPPLQLFFVAVAMTFLSAIVSDGLIAAHEQRFLTTMSTINLLINIVGNIILVPHLGAVACGIMLIVTETIGVTLSQWRLRRHGVMPLPVGYIARLLPAAALALGAIWLTYDLPLAVPMIAGGVGYAVGAFLVGAVPASMRNALLGALRPRSLDRMEAEDAGDRPDATEIENVNAVDDEPGSDAIPSLAPKPTESPASALDAPTTKLGEQNPPHDAGVSVDAPTTELDPSELRTVRLRTAGKHVQVRVIRGR